jgi:hypothetical protein
MRVQQRGTLKIETRVIRRIMQGNSAAWVQNDDVEWR